MQDLMQASFRRAEGTYEEAAAALGICAVPDLELSCPRSELSEPAFWSCSIDWALKYNVEALDLSGKDLNTRPAGLSRATSVTTLTLDSNRITSDGVQLGAFDGMTNLTTLSVNSNLLVSLPDAVKSLAGNLLTLNVGSNPIFELPPWIGSLHVLQSLDVTHRTDSNRSDIRIAPDSMPPSLQVLRLDSNALQAAPTLYVNKSCTMKSIYFHDNDIQVFPDWVRACPLSVLDIGTNKLGRVYTAESDDTMLLIDGPAFSRITTIFLADNELKDFQFGPAISGPDLADMRNGPNGLGCGPGRGVDSIEFDGAYACDCTGTNHTGDNCQIHAESSAVTEMTPTYRMPPGLKVVWLDYNRLTAFPRGISEHGKGIIALCLRNNLIEELPAEAGNMEYMMYLYMTDNKMPELTEEAFCRWRRMVDFRMGSNFLTKIPDCIGDMAGLKILHLQRNFITAVPASIQRLALLEQLVLSHNRISLVPDFIDSFVTTRSLFALLDHNPSDCSVAWQAESGVPTRRLVCDCAPDYTGLRSCESINSFAVLPRFTSLRATLTMDPFANGHVELPTNPVDELAFPMYGGYLDLHYKQDVAATTYTCVGSGCAIDYEATILTDSPVPLVQPYVLTENGRL